MKLFFTLQSRKTNRKTIMRTPSPGKNEWKHPVSHRVKRYVFGNQVLMLLNKKHMRWYSKSTLEMPTYRNKSTSMYKLWYKVHYSSACNVKKPPLTTKSKKKQNHHEQTWFKKNHILWCKIWREYDHNLLLKETSTLPNAVCASDLDVFAFWTSKVRRSRRRQNRMGPLVSLQEVWEMWRRKLSGFLYIYLLQWNFPNSGKKRIHPMKHMDDEY